MVVYGTINIVAAQMEGRRSGWGSVEGLQMLSLVRHLQIGVFIQLFRVVASASLAK